jgi:hypothetical protein
MSGKSAKPLSMALTDGSRAFATTHWSVVLAAKESASPEGAKALAELCQAYWYPLDAFVRRRSHDPFDGQDLTQEFCARLVEKEFLRLVDPGRGRFRSFIRASSRRLLPISHDAKREVVDAALGKARKLAIDGSNGPPQHCRGGL